MPGSRELIPAFDRADLVEPAVEAAIVVEPLRIGDVVNSNVVLRSTR